MKTISEIKEIIQKHEDQISSLRGQIIHVPRTLWVENEYDTNRDFNVIEYFNQLQDDELTTLGVSLRDEIINKIKKLNTILDEQHEIACEHNNSINKKIKHFKNLFKGEINIPEMKLSSRMVISARIIEEQDRKYFIDAYKSIGITHYVSDNKKDYIYYDPEQVSFQTLKDDMIRSLPLNIQKKYPKIADSIHNNKINTRPEKNTELFEVILAKKV